MFDQEDEAGFNPLFPPGSRVASGASCEGEKGAAMSNPFFSFVSRSGHAKRSVVHHREEGHGHV